MPSPERATCAGCGLVCEDITAVVGDDGGLERLERTCPLGDAWFAARVDPAAPPARVDGREVGVEEALDAAAPLDGASGLAFQARGASTATLGEVRDRAEVVVIWRADPATTHPRLFERLRLPAAGRELVVADARRTATAEDADTFLELPA